MATAATDRERYVTVWSRWPDGLWVVERSWPLRYVEDVLGVTDTPTRTDRGREVRWFERGTNPNTAGA